jgi:DNA-binding IclR family transcriptional regulator
MPINPSPAALRACDLLEVLADSPGRRFSVSELSRRAKVPRATCDSVMLAFLDRGWVARDEEARYSLAARCIGLGDAARKANPVLEVAAAEAADLARRLGACVAVSTRDGHHIRVTDVSDFSPPFSVSVRIGQSVPVRAPFAAVFVAWQGPESVERWLGDSELNDVARAEYEGALEEVRRRGFSVNVNRDGRLLEQFAELSGSDPTAAKEISIDVVFQALVGSHHLPSHVEEGASMRVSLMSAPIFDSAGSVVAALMVLGPSGLMVPSDIESLGAALLGSADTVTHASGGLRPPVAA